VSGGPAPELLTSRRDRPGPQRWSVEAGAARRGEAWTDLLGCVMRVPYDGGAHGRLVRAHELMHARVSPLRPGAFQSWTDLDARSVECAEEFRVNHLLARLGFDVDELRDGSERLTGTRLADAGEWREAVWFAAALSGTRALRDLLSGIRRVEPTWATACRGLDRELLRYARRVSTASLASTQAPHEALPAGFATHTRALAQIVARIAARPTANARAPTSTGRGARPLATGVFAPLVLDEAVVLDRRVVGSIAPRRSPAPTGRRVTRPDRLLTDPSRRVFDRATRGSGGIVVVDQSGSMALSSEDLGRLLRAAPGSFVLGYSHAPGSSGVPNAWVLADRGRAASVVRPGNVGNGVDGPALRLALSKRRSHEPIVWVCDGQVTDSGDHADLALAAECARLVVRHGIQMVASVDEALERLGSRAPPLGRVLVLGRVAGAVTPAT
jgi:hypothetical protein